MTEFDLTRIKQISPSDLETAGLIQKSPRGSRKEGHGYCCVYCTSGTGQNKSGGLDFDYRGDAWVHTCRACGNGGDNIKFFQHVFNADFADACRQASEMFGIPIAESNNFGDKTYRRPTAPLPKPAVTQPPRLKLPEKTLPEQVPLIKDDIAQAQKNLEQLPEDQRRGLLLDTLKYFNCGFAPRWVHPVCRLEGKKVKPTPRIIIPTSDGEHYLALALDRDRKLDPKNSFHKPHAGAKTKVFNAADLRHHETIIVVEGEVDAMSIFQAYTSTTDADVGVVATLSAGGWKNLIIAQIDNGLFEWHKFIILFDNDDAGHKTADEFKAELEKRGCPAVIKFLDDYVSLPFINNYISPETKEQLKNSKIDANAMLKICGRSNLAYALSKIFSDAEKEFGDIHNQRTLDFNAAPVETTTAAETSAQIETATAALATAKSILDAKIDEWQKNHGTIEPETLANLIQYSSIIANSEITVPFVTDTTVQKWLGMFKYYSPFAKTTEDLLLKLRQIRDDARRKVAKYERMRITAEKLAPLKGDSAYDGLDDAKPTDIEKQFAALEVKYEVERKITSFITAAKKAHKKYLDQLEIDNRNARTQAEVKAYVENPPTTQDSLPDCPINLALPYGVYFDETGVKMVDMDKPAGRNGRTVVTACENPVVPVRAFHAPVERGEQSTCNDQYEIAIKGANRWRYTIVDARTLQDAHSITELNNHGAHISNPTACTKYFAKIIAENERNGRLKVTDVYTQPGWHGDTFIYPTVDDDADYIVRNGNFDYRGIFTPRGDKDAWLKMFKRVLFHNPKTYCSLPIIATDSNGKKIKVQPADNPNNIAPKPNLVAALALGFMFGAPLIKPLDIRNQQMSFSFESGNGKTAAAKFAASFFGRLENGLAPTLNATTNFLEDLAAKLNDFPHVVDELQSAKKNTRENIDELIYNFSNGITRGRADIKGNARPIYHFNGARLFTAEQSVTNFNSGQGAIARVFEVTHSSLFEDSFAIEIHGFVQDNYGHFGREFCTEYIPKNLKRIKAFFKETQKGCYNEYGTLLSSHATFL
ncbi:MAG: DUF927 domain-containing protein, partial [Selenomonadaceae bacterium]|nr:DUF927 domain-containing protein [Selenomonadaceae bacterium]